MTPTTATATQTSRRPPPERAVDMYWRTPIYTADYSGQADTAEHNAALRELILAAERTDTRAENFGGIDAIKSSEDILLWDHPSIDWLKGSIADAVSELTRNVLGPAADEISPQILAEGWAVVYRSGGSLRPHTHHDSNWSGVYYVDNPPGNDTEQAGYLQLLDPRQAAIARHASPGPVRFAPNPGRLVAFPGWLVHSVRSTATNAGLRIVIAWNVGYDKTLTRIGRAVPATNGATS